MRLSDVGKGAWFVLFCVRKSQNLGFSASAWGEQRQRNQGTHKTGTECQLATAAQRRMKLLVGICRASKHRGSKKSKQTHLQSSRFLKTENQSNKFFLERHRCGFFFFFKVPVIWLRLCTPSGEYVVHLRQWRKNKRSGKKRL
jgi:hypothetical protein